MLWEALEKLMQQSMVDPNFNSDQGNYNLVNFKVSEI